MKVYKDLFYINLTLTLVGAVIIGMLLGTGDRSTTERIVLACVLVAWIAGNSLFWQSRASSRTKKLEDKYRNCEVKEYVDEYLSLDANSPGYADVMSKNEVKFNLAKGCYAEGLFDEVPKVLDTVKLRNVETIKDLKQKLNYHRLMALYYLEKNMLDEGEDELASCYGAMDLSKSLANRLPKERAEIDQAVAFLNMRDGDIDGLEEKFKSWIESAKYNIDKAPLKYRLAEIYWYQGRKDESRELFKEVAEIGGNTFFGKRAKEAMNRRGNQNVNLSIPPKS